MNLLRSPRYVEQKMRAELLLGLLACIFLVQANKSCLVNDFSYCGIDPDKKDCIPEIPKVADQDLELVQVFAVLRHGDRNFYGPDVCWFERKDLYDCVDVDLVFDSGKKCGIEVLTLRGFKQEIINGKMLKNAYSNILPSKLDGQIYVASTNSSRTITSAEGALFGMFGEDGQIPNSKDYLPFIDIQSKEFTIIYPNTFRFPILDKWNDLAIGDKNEANYPNVVKGIREFYKSINQPLNDSYVLVDNFDCVNVISVIIKAFMEVILHWMWQILSRLKSGD